MNSLVVGLCLTAPAQPPGYLPYPPTVRVQPQVVPAAYPTPFGPGYRPFPTAPAYYSPTVQTVPAVPQIVTPVQPVPVPALTLEQFSRSFTPTAGKHHVMLIHPCTQQPVAVCFTLPHCGKLDRFEVRRRSIEFEFCRPNVEVEIIFRHNGTVDVRYRD